MEPKFDDAVRSLHPSFQRLLEMAPIVNGALPAKMPRSGVYLFSEGADHLYVGRSNNLRGRYGRHCRPGATFLMAAFAFRLARLETGRTVACYKPGAESRLGLMGDQDFSLAFDNAKARIRPPWEPAETDWWEGSSDCYRQREGSSRATDAIRHRRIRRAPAS